MEVRTYPEYSKNYPLLLTAFMKRPVCMYPDEAGVVYRNPATGKYFRFTWREWYERTCRLANALKALGVKPGKPGEPGDRVATIALNHHYHLELYYAVSCLGAVLHPINMRLSLDHIVHTITHSEDRIIFFDDVFLPLVERIYDRIKDTVDKFVYISDKPGRPETRIENLYTYNDLVMQQSPEFEWPMLHEDTYATLCYTTGTTGLPKGVMFTHSALYLMALHVFAMAELEHRPLSGTPRRGRCTLAQHPHVPHPRVGSAILGRLRERQTGFARHVHGRRVLRSCPDGEGHEHDTGSNHACDDHRVSGPGEV